VVAHQDEMLFRVQFLVGAGGNVTHGHEDAAFDVGGCELPRFADVDEAGFAFFEQGGGFGGGEFEIEHGTSVMGGQGSEVSESAPLCP